MDLAFKVADGAESVEIPNVGIADDQAGVPVERAAERLAVLQDKDGVPLTGPGLAKAAKKWAALVGLTVDAPASDAAHDDTVESDLQAATDAAHAAEEPA